MIHKPGVAAIIVFLFLTLLNGFSQAATPPSTGQKKWFIDLDQAQGRVEFKAMGRPSALKILGKGPSPRGKLTIQESNIEGQITVNLDEFDTGIRLRNEHMKTKYLETGKFPQALLKVTKTDLSKLDFSKDFPENSFSFDGTLSLHGVDRPIQGLAKLKRDANSLWLEAEFPLKLSEFGITPPSFAGITVAEEVQVFVEVSTPIQLAKPQ